MKWKLVPHYTRLCWSQANDSRRGVLSSGKRNFWVVTIDDVQRKVYRANTTAKFMEWPQWLKEHSRDAFRGSRCSIGWNKYKRNAQVDEGDGELCELLSCYCARLSSFLICSYASVYLVNMINAVTSIHRRSEHEFSDSLLDAECWGKDESDTSVTYAATRPQGTTCAVLV